MSRFPSFHDLLDSFTAGFIKKALIGAGLTLGTTGTVLITLNKLIDNMRDAPPTYHLWLWQWQMLPP